MKILGFGVIVLLLCLNTAAADETAIAEVIGRYKDAFNKRDVSTIEKIWTEDAVLKDLSAGTEIVGRAAIIRNLAAVFSEETAPTLSVSWDTVTATGDGGFVVTGVNTLAFAVKDEIASESFAFSAAIVSNDGGWQIKQVTESALNQLVDGDPLSAIQWLIGSWIVEDGDNEDVTEDSPLVNRFSWMPGGQFVVRTFATADQMAGSNLGYQIIGAIPEKDSAFSRSLRSWTFIGDGSVSQATWLIDGNRISIASQGRLADGSETSGTYVLKRVGDDEIELKIVGHTISGELVPSDGTVKLVRQPAIMEESTAESNAGINAANPLQETK